MSDQFLTEQDFKSFSSYMPAIVSIGTVAVMIFLVEITHTRFMGGFVIIIPLLTGRLALHFDFMRWKKQMIATGQITYQDFDSLAEKYKISARQWISKKERAPLLFISFLSIASSIYIFRQDLELKLYGREITGTVYRVDANIALPSYAFIEFFVDGKRYTTATKVQMGDNISPDNRVYYHKWKQVIAKPGQTFRILYSSKDPEVNKLLDDFPINK